VVERSNAVSVSLFEGGCCHANVMLYAQLVLTILQMARNQSINQVIFNQQTYVTIMYFSVGSCPVQRSGLCNSVG
jgi:hypothetical protein